MNYYYQIINDNIEVLRYKKSKYTAFLSSCKTLLQSNRDTKDEIESLRKKYEENIIINGTYIGEKAFNEIKEKMSEIESTISSMIDISSERLKILEKRIAEEQEKNANAGSIAASGGSLNNIFNNHMEG